jgi:hypothetical protein
MPKLCTTIVKTFDRVIAHPTTWPLQRWGMDLVGPLPPSQGGNKFVVVTVEYFTRWIEAKPLVSITLKIVKFF